MARAAFIPGRPKRRKRCSIARGSNRTASPSNSISDIVGKARLGRRPLSANGARSRSWNSSAAANQDFVWLSEHKDRESRYSRLLTLGGVWSRIGRLFDKTDTLGIMFKTRRARPDLEKPERTYTSTDVARIAQVSLRQLQWWDERKVVSPRHEGTKRIYDLPEEVVEITVIAELRRKRLLPSEDSSGLAISTERNGPPAGRRPRAGDSGLHLLTDGVHLPRRPAGSIIDS